MTNSDPIVSHNTCSGGLTETAANWLDPGYFSQGGKSVVILPNHLEFSVRIRKVVQMNTRKISLMVASAVALYIIYVFAPVYGFYAYRGGAPLPPWGWLEIPVSVPMTHEVYDSSYQPNGDKALVLLAAHRQAINVPAISAAVAIDGKLIWAGATGWADLATSTAVTPETEFRIGSTSKALTATALARLVDRGVIDLDAPISSYVLNLPNDSWSNITPRHLASHMSGLPHYKENTDMIGLYHTTALQKNFRDVFESLTVFDSSELLFKPGEGFHYSTLGTVLQGAVIASSTGLPYREVMQREVFGPADMSATFVEPKSAIDKPNMATFYLRREGKFRKWRSVNLSHRLPGGAWVSTPSDLARLGVKHLDEAFLSTQTTQSFWTPQSLNSGEVNEQDYAIGWRWREYDVDGVGLVRNANHGGVSRGSQAWLMVLPDYNMAIAFCMNTNVDDFSDFNKIYSELISAFAPAGISVSE